MRALSAFDRWLGAEGSSRPMGLLRLLVGLILWARWADLLAAYRWVELGDVPISLGVLLGSTALVVGWWSRTAALLTGGLQCWLILFSGREGWDSQHTWLLAIVTLLLAFTPCDRSFSLDRWLALRSSAGAPPERGSVFGARLIALQVTALYLFATLGKLDVAFLSGERLEMIAGEVYMTSAWTPPGLHVAALVSAWGVVAMEGFLTFALWFRRTRPLAILVGLFLHAMLYVLIPVATFSVTTVAMYLAFVDADAFHRAIDRLLGAGTPDAPRVLGSPPDPGTVRPEAG